MTERGDESLERDSPLGSTSIGTDDNGILPIRDLLLDVSHHDWFRIQVIDGDIEETLYLRSVQVECDDMVGTSDGKEVGDESGVSGRLHYAQVHMPNLLPRTRRSGKELTWR